MTEPNDIDPELLDSEFPIRSTCSYLNNAAIGPLPARSVRAAEEYLHDQGSCANGGYTRWTERLWRAKEHFAALIGTVPETLAVSANTSRGLLLVANGLDWNAGDNILIPKFEFPANVYPWMNLADRGVELRVVPEREGGRFHIDDFAALADDHTRLISVSFVEYSTGYRHDLTRLGAFCAERGILFCVDSIQGLGVIPLDVRTAGIDFLSADGHKWMLGPCGAGFLYCRPEAMEKIRHGFRGWGSVAQPGSYEDWTQPLAPDARRFEEGTPNYPGLYALEKSLELIREIGLERIQRRVMALTGHLVEGLDARGYRVMSPLGEGERSGIIAFRSDRFDSRELYLDLHSRNIVTAFRRGWVRASPHFYNRIEDIDRLLEALPGH